MPPQTSHIPRITVIAGERVYLNDGVNSDESIPATIEMDFETRVIRAVHRGRVIPRADYEAMSEVELVDYIEAHNGQVVMPGLIDAHVMGRRWLVFHFTGSNPLT